jgi:hypothetical protein
MINEKRSGAEAMAAMISQHPDNAWTTHEL